MSSNDPWTTMQETEHALHTLTVQRQSLQAQLGEVEHALAALPESGDAWRVIGNIMVKRDAATLRAELTERKALLHARTQHALKQEQEVRERMRTLQQEIIKEKGDAS